MMLVLTGTPAVALILMIGGLGWIVQVIWTESYPYLFPAASLFIASAVLLAISLNVRHRFKKRFPNHPRG